MKKQTSKTKTTKKKTTKKIVTTSEPTNEKFTLDVTHILGLLGCLCLILPLIMPWLEYWKVSKTVLDTLTSIEFTLIALAILCFLIIPIYKKLREDRKDKFTFERMKPSDKFYRYISPDTVFAIIGFSFIGIATAIVKGINETSYIVEKIGDEMLAEALIIATLAVIFYTAWVLYCNRLKTTFEKIRYIVVLILLIAFIIFIAIG